MYTYIKQGVNSYSEYNNKYLQRNRYTHFFLQMRPVLSLLLAILFLIDVAFVCTTTAFNDALAVPVRGTYNFTTIKSAKTKS